MRVSSCLLPEVGPQVTTGTFIQARHNKTQEEKDLGNVFLTPTMKIYTGSVGVPPFIFNLDIRYSLTARPVYSRGKRLPHPLNRRLGAPGRPFFHCGEKKNSFPAGIRTPNRPYCSLVTMLSRIPSVSSR